MSGQCGSGPESRNAYDAEYSFLHAADHRNSSLLEITERYSRHDTAAMTEKIKPDEGLVELATKSSESADRRDLLWICMKTVNVT